MATNTIGAAGNFTTIAAWASAVKAIGTLAEDEVGQLIDDAVYARGASTDLDFSGVTLNGFTITLEAEASVKHNGDFGNGARTVEAVASAQLYNVKQLIMKDLSFHNTATANGARCLQNIDNSELYRVIGKSDTAGSNSEVFYEGAVGGILFEACRSVGGTSGFRMNTDTSTLNACTALDSVGSGFNLGSFNSGVQNCVAYNSATTDFSGGSGYSPYTNCASEDATAGGTSFVHLTGNPFDVDGYTPLEAGELDGAGVDLSIALDAANNPYAVPPAIGAYEVAGVGPTVPVLSNPTQPVYTP